MTDNAELKRYTEFPLPSRKYIPGQGIHPDRHPQGSHIPEIPPEDKEFTMDNWQYCQRYLYAIDLFNAGYWWEAHEVLEELWVESGRTTEIARFLQGVIQVSAALLKVTISNPRGAIRLAERGIRKLRSQTGVYLGINIHDLVRSVGNKVQDEDFPLPEIVLTGLEKG